MSTFTDYTDEANIVRLRARGGGGGSSSNPLQVTFSAADIAARWDDGASGAAMEITSIQPGETKNAVFDIENTLDNNVGTSTAYAYLPGADTADVAASGEQAADFMDSSTFPKGTYAWELNNIPKDHYLLLPGSAFYVFLQSFSGAPTSGSLTVGILT